MKTAVIVIPEHFADREYSRAILLALGDIPADVLAYLDSL